MMTRAPFDRCLRRSRRTAQTALASLVILTTVGAGLAVTAPALAAAPARLTSHLTSRGHASLVDVSCQRSWCMAVGSYVNAAHKSQALAQEWNGTSWKVVSSPLGGQLTSVSCSSPTFCLADGGPTGTERWNGQKWLAIKGPTAALSAPTCGSKSWCLVIRSGNAT